jgi:cell division protein FtsB
VTATTTAVVVRRAVWPLLAGLVVVGLLFVGVFPTRAWLSQRDAIGDASERLTVLREQNEALEGRVRVLGTDEEIERLAREQYNLVRPGEEAYALLPPAAPTTAAPGDDWTRRVVDNVARIRGEDPLAPR